MVGSGTTTVWCGVTFVPNLLLLVFYRPHADAHKGETIFVWCGWVWLCGRTKGPPYTWVMCLWLLLLLFVVGVLFSMIWNVLFQCFCCCWMWLGRLLGCGRRGNGVLTLVVVVVWDDDGGEWCYHVLCGVLWCLYLTYYCCCFTQSICERIRRRSRMHVMWKGVVLQPHKRATLHVSYVVVVIAVVICGGCLV